MNIACGIEYDGTDYHGFQRQAPRPTVQGVLETAIARISSETSIVHGAGRTDAGVHASGQVVNFHTNSQLTPQIWLRALNAVLPSDIAVRWTNEVPDHFHARFSAISRSYRYTIWNDSVPTALRARYSYHRSRALAVDLMHQACQALLGRKDFGAFGSSPNKTNAKKPQPEQPQQASLQRVRTMLAAACTHQDTLIYCDFTANAFLTGMVRSIVGTLLLVGQKRLSLDEFATIVQLADKTHPGSAAPSHGLCLVQVNYPEEFSLKQGT